MLKSFFALIILLSGPISAGDFDLAVELYKKGQYTDSRVIFSQILKANPSDLKSIEYLGDIEGQLKSWDKALVYYGRLKELRPSVADYHYKYGGVLGMKAKDSNKFAALGMIGDIRRSFEEAIRLDPSHIDARWALIEFYLQLPGILGGSEEKATRYANELLKISPVDGYLAKGRIAEYSLHFTLAEKYYKKAVETGGSKTSYQKLADLYKNKMNQPEKAREILAEFSHKNKS